MMEPEQQQTNRKERAGREITYQVGWKRGKIKLDTVQPAEGGEPSVKPEHAGTQLSRFEQWNIHLLWREAGTVRDGVLQAVLWAFPAVVFGMSLWLIYQLSFLP